MSREDFEIRLISINFTIIVKKNMELLCRWFGIMLTRRLILHKLTRIRKIENYLLLLELSKLLFFVDQKVVVRTNSVIVITITKKLSRPVQFRSEFAKLK